MFCSNNYLGLSNHPRLKEAALEAVRTHGVGSGSVRPIAGTMDLHVELEQRLARFKGAEASLVYQTGFATNAGLIPQLVGEGDLVVSDELNHGSIIDGVRLSRAERARLPARRHRRTSAQVLSQGRRAHVPRTDGSSSSPTASSRWTAISRRSTGSLASRADHGAMVYVDDAHGEGVLGEGGRGIVSHFHLARQPVHVEMGTFSKAFGVVGGHISGSQDLVRTSPTTSRGPGSSAGPTRPRSPPPAPPRSTSSRASRSTSARLWSHTRRFKSAMQSLGLQHRATVRRRSRRSSSARAPRQSG